MVRCGPQGAGQESGRGWGESGTTWSAELGGRGCEDAAGKVTLPLLICQEGALSPLPTPQGGHSDADLSRPGDTRASDRPPPAPDTAAGAAPPHPPLLAQSPQKHNIRPRSGQSQALLISGTVWASTRGSSGGPGRVGRAPRGTKKRWAPGSGCPGPCTSPSPVSWARGSAGAPPLHRLCSPARSLKPTHRHAPGPGLRGAPPCPAADRVTLLAGGSFHQRAPNTGCGHWAERLTLWRWERQAGEAVPFQGWTRLAAHVHWPPPGPSLGPGHPRQSCHAQPMAAAVTPLCSQLLHPGPRRGPQPQRPSP